MTDNFSVKQILNRVFAACVFCVLYGVIAGYTAAMHWFVAFAVICGTMLAGGFFLMVRWSDEAFRYSQGIRGEIKVAAILAQLSAKDFWVAHDVIIPGALSNLDHVVVGANGIWVIETKHWAAKTIRLENGALNVDGYQSDSVVKAIKTLKGSAAALNDYLTSNGIHLDWVQPVLVFSANMTTVAIPGRYQNVVIVGFRDLVARLQGEKSRIDSKIRIKIRDALQRLVA